MLLAVLAVMGSQLAFAHDYWLSADPVVASPTEKVELRLHSGHSLESLDEKAYQQTRVLKFEDVVGGKHYDLTPLTADGTTPFLAAIFQLPGSHVVALDRSPSIAELPAAEFSAYLTEKGLDAVIADRETSQESDAPARERYQRFLKAYVQVGLVVDLTDVTETGQKLEIIPGVNPLALKPNERLPARVLFEGQPLAGVLLIAAVRLPGGKIASLQLRTDDKGEVRIELFSPGLWLLQVVHMQRAGISDERADWDSYWASCTFSVPAAATEEQTAPAVPPDAPPN
jgi:uncharacterized GH25 family protein